MTLIDGPTARNICTRVFATSSFSFDLPTYFVSNCCYGRRVFQTKAELFDCGVANDMSKVTRMLVCTMSTPCFCFVPFSLLWIILKNKFCLASSETGVTFLQEDYSTHQFA